MAFSHLNKIRPEGIHQCLCFVKHELCHQMYYYLLSQN